MTIPDDQQDKQLPEKLVEERSGILKWCVEGCLAWQREGLGDVEAVAEATAEYRSENDILGDFFTECGTIGDAYKVKSSALYLRYREWCDKAGEKPISRKKLGDRLRTRGFKRSKSGALPSLRLLPRA